MKLSGKLSFYIIKRFAMDVLIIITIFAFVAYLIDILDLMRKSTITDAHFAKLAYMAMLKLPTLLFKLLPFTFLLSAIFCYSKLNSSHEIIAARSAGISIWQLMFPSLVTSLFIGILAVLVFNHISTIMLEQRKKYEETWLKENSKVTLVSSNGMWIKDFTAENEKIIARAKKLDLLNAKLSSISIFVMDKDKFSHRIDADNALISNDYWILNNVQIRYKDGRDEIKDEMNFPTNINIGELQESLAAPEAVSLWKLPKFIRDIKEAGFAHSRHLYQFFWLLILPFYLAAMTFFSSAFSFSLYRGGKTGFLMGIGLLSGFVIYFFSDIISALAIAGNMPILLAAIAPTLATSLLALAIILHIEEG